MPGPNHRTRRTPAGTFLEILPSTGGLLVGVYRFKSHHRNYISATPWNGSTEGALVKIAKPFELWSDLTGDTIDHVRFTYSDHDDANQTRHAVGDDGTVEDQVIVPRYTPDTLIWAISAMTMIANDGSLQASPPTKPDMGLLDLNRGGRCYAQI